MVSTAHLYIVVITAAASVGFTSSHGQPGTSFRLICTVLLLLPLQALAMLLSKLSGCFSSSCLVRLQVAAGAPVLPTAAGTAWQSGKRRTGVQCKQHVGSGYAVVTNCRCYRSAGTVLCNSIAGLAVCQCSDPSGTVRAAVAQGLAALPAGWLQMQATLTVR
jgi:hypothetical protein